MATQISLITATSAANASLSGRGTTPTYETIISEIDEYIRRAAAQGRYEVTYAIQSWCITDETLKSVEETLDSYGFNYITTYSDDYTLIHLNWMPK